MNPLQQVAPLPTGYKTYTDYVEEKSATHKEETTEPSELPKED